LYAGCQSFDKPLIHKQHLASHLFPRRTLADSLRHKRLVLPLSRSTLQTKLRQQPVDCQKGRRGSKASGRSIAGPRTGIGFASPFGADWIQHHIPEEFEQIALSIHENSLEAAL
jgi:hypothetical protein